MSASVVEVTGVMSPLTLTCARSIRGWMSDAELQWLASIAAHSDYIVEIGTFAGRSTRAMADNLPFRGRLISVDPYEPYDSEPHIITGHSHGLDLRSEAIENLLDLIHSRTVDLFRCTSVEASALIPDSSADLVFIDGDHSYSAVLTDIDAWTPKLKPGGILAGHDYGVHDGVTKAVKERFTKDGCAFRFRLPAGSIWYVWKARM